MALPQYGDKTEDGSKDFIQTKSCTEKIGVNTLNSKQDKGGMHMYVLHD